MNKFVFEDLNINYQYEEKSQQNPSENLVLFLHGFGDSLKTSYSFSKEKNKNFRLAAFDFISCGASDYKQNLKLETYGKLTEFFINNILKNENNIYIVSHSLGAFSALYVNKNSKVKYTFLASPFSPWNKENLEHKKFLINHLLPENNEDKKISYFDLFYNPSNLAIVNSTKIFDKLNSDFYTKRKTAFEKMVNDQIVNFDFLSNDLYALYKDAKNYCAISGEDDKYVKIESLEELASELNFKLYKLSKTGHAIFFDSFQKVLEIILSQIKE
ncbi:alpha/beta fold hydrolase [Mycoplasmopsis synoviae]|uniref:Alpha/beta hydrolase n=1 Tax=Mycoplasmopsis synoviae TaxID=2109 RepID=A0AAN1EDY9_MYCSY|nr:alpha/beta fold hydrolase [Mycoplasmopsis synoviae]AKJ20987.1 Triacylglycerol lipase [Mycoplasmopsis synoviae]AQU48322.1 Triacylglycerol lipase [Mycoplasmopsis synoviae]AWL83901.1 alpha/beta hydrolase [Mycoplasmopsis synoviae]QGL45245.1 alpha/beta hydrolase [Mycoplasmopsis synoviae]QLE13631.1 alpha/beta hydrolase [Mycoplasmopsis synoviae]